VREERKQLIHGLEIGSVVDETSPAPTAHQTHAREVGKMEGQCRRRDAEPLGNLAGIQALRPGFHQQPERRQARFVTQCREEFRGMKRFHILSIVEMKTDSQAPRASAPGPRRSRRHPAAAPA
jgi:hypothetical protein